MSNNKNMKCFKSYNDNDYPVDVSTDISPGLRSKNAYTPMASPPVNGGLYCGPQNNAPWMPKSVPATTTYFMQELLKNADPPPPPGATEQYPGDNRMGNNYVSMPGVSWFNSAYGKQGPYRIKVIDNSGVNTKIDNVMNYQSDLLSN